MTRTASSPLRRVLIRSVALAGIITAISALLMRYGPMPVFTWLSSFYRPAVRFAYWIGGSDMPLLEGLLGYLLQSLLIALVLSVAWGVIEALVVRARSGARDPEPDGGPPV